MLDLYVCLRPVRYFAGVPSPVKSPEKVDMVIFRENTEDIYAGIEWAAGTAEAKKIYAFLKAEFPKAYKKVRFPETAGIGIKPVSRQGTERLMEAAINYAIIHKRKSVNIVHKGNIMKYTEGAFRDWAYGLAKSKFGAIEMDGGPWCKIPDGKAGAGIIIKDSIADITLQQVLTRPDEFDVIATPQPQRRLPLRPPWPRKSAALASPPAATSTTSPATPSSKPLTAPPPKYANLDVVNPGSVILSGVMMLEHLGWNEAANAILKGLETAIKNKTVTYDFARLMQGPRRSSARNSATKSSNTWDRMHHEGLSCAGRAGRKVVHWERARTRRCHYAGAILG